MKLSSADHHNAAASSAPAPHPHSTPLPLIPAYPTRPPAGADPSGQAAQRAARGAACAAVHALARLLHRLPVDAVAHRCVWGVAAAAAYCRASRQLLLLPRCTFAKLLMWHLLVFRSNNFFDGHTHLRCQYVLQRFWC